MVLSFLIIRGVKLSRYPQPYSKAMENAQARCAVFCITDIPSSVCLLLTRACPSTCLVTFAPTGLGLPSTLQR